MLYAKDRLNIIINIKFNPGDSMSEEDFILLCDILVSQINEFRKYRREELNKYHNSCCSYYDQTGHIYFIC